MMVPDRQVRVQESFAAQSVLVTVRPSPTDHHQGQAGQLWLPAEHCPCKEILYSLQAVRGAVVKAGKFQWMCIAIVVSFGSHSMAVGPL